MRVAVLIVAFGNADDVACCLKALAASTYRDFSVHICENGGAEAFARLQAAIAHLPIEQPVKAIQAPDNLGFAGGNNLLARQAEDWDAVWILNPDTQPEAGALEALVNKLRQPGYGIVGARLAYPNSRTIQLFAGRWRAWRGDGYNIGLGASIDTVPDVQAVEREMDYVNGASMLVSRSFIDRVGLMPEDYFLYCEEVDWCLSRGAFRLGYAHDALVWHEQGTTIGSSSDRRKRSALSTYLTERNKLLLTARHFPRHYPVTALVSLALIGRYLAAGSPRNFRVALRGWYHGLRGRSGRPSAADIGATG